MAIIDRRDQLALGASTISAALGANPVTQFSPAETFFSDPDGMKDGSTEFTYTKLLKNFLKLQNVTNGFWFGFLKVGPSSLP